MILAIASIGTERIAPGTCTRRSTSIQRLIVSASQEGPGVPGVATQNSKFQVWRENFLFFEKFFPDTPPEIPCSITQPQ
jgi:hypothetical protein